MLKGKHLSAVFLFFCLMGVSFAAHSQADLTATKTNTTQANQITQGGSFEWHVQLSNIGDADAQFSTGNAVFTDPLPNVPDTTATYGPPTSSSTSVDCTISHVSTIAILLTCTANANFVLAPKSPIDIVIPVHVAAGAPLEDLVNPAPGSFFKCAVDPSGHIHESDESNNECAPDTVTVITGAISLAKTVMLAGGNCETNTQNSLNISTPGDVTYCYTVTNAGNGDISGLKVDDDLLRNITGCTPKLAAGASTTCSKNKTVTQDEIDAGINIVNRGTVSATGVDPASDTATLTFHAPAMTLEKKVMLRTAGSACETDAQDSLRISEPREVMYCYKVTNTGNVRIEDLKVTDDLLVGDITNDCSTHLIVGGGTTCTRSHSVRWADINAGKDIVNTGTATTTTTGVAPVTDTATLTFTTLSLVKTALPTTYQAVGDKIAYRYVVTNTGTVDLNPGATSVTDDKVTVTCPPAAPVAPGGTVTCTAGYSITQADLKAGSVVNKATATVDGVTSTEASATVTAVARKSISLAKTVMAAGGNCETNTQDSLNIIVPGDVTYCYKVTNTGNVRIAGLAVSDDLLTDPVTGCSETLAVGASTTCSTNKTVTQDEINARTDIVNTGTATTTTTGVDDATDTATLTFHAPDLTATKTNTVPAGGIPQGGSFEWHVQISNIGNADAHFGIGSDLFIDQLPDIPNATTPYGTPTSDSPSVTCELVDVAGLSLICNPNKDFVLVPKSTINIVLPVNVATDTPAQDLVNPPPGVLIGCKVNWAGEIDESDKTNNNCTDTVTVIPGVIISLAKTVMLQGGSCGTDDHDSLHISAPGNVTYCYKVTNTGAVSIDGLTVTDDLLYAVSGCDATLAAGASTTCHIDKTVTQIEIDKGTDIVNTGTASATGATDGTDTATLIFQLPDLTATKTNTAPVNGIPPGGSFEWHVKLSNIGNADALFQNEGELFADELPTVPGALVTYGTPTSDSPSVDCELRKFLDYIVLCKANKDFALKPQSTIKIVIPANVAADTPAQDLVNPISPLALGWGCKVDFYGQIEESDETNNDCTDTVTIIPRVTSLAKTVMAAGGSCGTDDHASLNIIVPGDVTYCYKVTNTGGESIDGLTVTDDRLGQVSGCDATLAAGASTTCSKDKTVTQNEVDAGTDIVNTGTASATGVADATDTATLKFVDHGPDLTATKTNTAPANGIRQGGSFEWYVKISNIGDADAHFSTGTRVFTDPLPLGPDYGELFFPDTVGCTLTTGAVDVRLRCLPTEDFVLTPQSTINITIPVTLATDAPLGDLVNPAPESSWACKVDPDQDIDESDESNNECSNTVVVIPGVISLAKTVMLKGGTCGTHDKDSLHISAPGDVTYCYKVTNVDVVSIEGLTVTDDLLTGPVTGCDATLAKGASTTCSKDKTVTQAEVNAGTEIVNTGTATTTTTGVADATDTATLTFHAPDLIATKTNTTSASQVSPGGSFEWHVKLSNSGSADAQFRTGNNVFIDELPFVPDTTTPLVTYGTPTSSNTSVDCKLTTLSDEFIVSCKANKDFVLAPQSTIDIVIPVNVAADTPAQDLLNPPPTAALGCKVNWASEIEESDETNNECTDTVTVISGPISLAKTVMLKGGSCGTDDQESLRIIVPGDVTYCYKVNNTGDVSIAGLGVTDDLLGGIDGCSATLAAGASTTCSKDKTVTQAEVDAGTDIVNTGTASATGVGPVTDTATLTFEIIFGDGFE